MYSKGCSTSEVSEMGRDNIGSKAMVDTQLQRSRLMLLLSLGEARQKWC